MKSLLRRVGRHHDPPPPPPPQLAEAAVPLDEEARTAAVVAVYNCVAEQPVVPDKREHLVDCFSYVDTVADAVCVHPINDGAWMPIREAHRHAARAYADIRAAGRRCRRIERRGPVSADSAWLWENWRDRREWFRGSHLWGGDPNPALCFQLELWTVGHTHRSVVVRRRDTPTAPPVIVGQVDFVFIK
jgi:hypothetical protein